MSRQQKRHTPGEILANRALALIGLLLALAAALGGLMIVVQAFRF